mmetsp:Transcript_4369/g.10692  ORF Transcript_4369/g.10692 Transcript_4369/m.10692 type:complete len:132 (-) Transcript_4369:94-489(-)
MARGVHVYSMEVLRSDLPPSGRTPTPSSSATTLTAAPPAPLCPVVYLYKLRPGTVATESHALECARDAAIPGAILARAAEARAAMLAGTAVPGRAEDGARARVLCDAVERLVGGGESVGVCHSMVCSVALQ